MPAPDRAAPEPWAPDRWVEEDDLRRTADRAVARATGAPDGGVGRGARRAPAAKDGGVPQRTAGAAGGRTSSPRLPTDLRTELAAAVGPRKLERVEGLLAQARRAYERERFQDARRDLAQLADAASTAASVRELYGLTLYRLGRWKQAAAELELFRQMSHSTEQNPVLADCYRALGRYHEVEALWDELRQASPSAALVAEGRIVSAGALADQGRLAEAIAVLEPAVSRRPALVQTHHLRLWYVLADLYGRAGDTPRSRALFEKIAHHDPDFGDVNARLRELGGS